MFLSWAVDGTELFAKTKEWAGWGGKEEKGLVPFCTQFIVFVNLYTFPLESWQIVGYVDLKAQETQKAEETDKYFIIKEINKMVPWYNMLTCRPYIHNQD